MKGDHAEDAIKDSKSQGIFIIAVVGIFAKTICFIVTFGIYV